MAETFEHVVVSAPTGETIVIPYSDEEIAAALAERDANDTAAVANAVPKQITRRQCAKEMLARNLITPQEALAMTKTGEAPGMVSAMFLQLPSETDRVSAEIDFAADSYLRDNPLLIGLMTATGASGADIDQFFIAASQR